MPPPTPHRTHAAAPLDAALVWFRRDLRAHDHAALYHALRSARHVWCAFVFDRDILDALSSRGLTADRRVEFIRDSLVQLDEALAALGRSHGRDGVRLLVVLLGEDPAPYALDVLQHAERQGLAVLDLASRYRERLAADPSLQTKWFRGHMTREGNQWVAEQVAAVLRQGR